MVTNAVTGKVSVGNGSNGLESRLLENSEIGYYDVLSVGTTIDLIQNEVYKVENSEFNSGVLLNNKFVIWQTGDVIGYTPDPTWEPVNALPSLNTTTTPNHNPITLDSEASTASKWFPVEVTFPNNEIGIGVIAEELASNAGVYDGQTNEFTMLSNGTLIDLNGVVVNTKFLVKRTGCFRRNK
jgi:hypothetical protein